MAEVSLYQKPSMTPENPNESDGEITRVLGTVGYSDVDTWIMALEWYAPTTLPAFADLGLWSLTGDDPTANSGTRLELLTFTIGSMTGGAWNRKTLATPRAWAANTPRLFQIHTDGHYTFSNPDTFPFSSADGTLHAYGEAEGGNGRWFNGGDSDDVATNQHPGGSGYNFFVNIITDVNGGPVSATIGQVTESGTVQQISKAKIFTLNFAIENGIVQPISKAKSKSVAQVTESGLILPPSFQKSKTVNQVTESGTVQPISKAKSKEVGQVSETGTVFALGELVYATIGQVVETGTVQPISKAKSKTIGQVTEAGTVQTVSKAKSKMIGQVTELGTVYSVTDAGVQSRMIGQVIELSSVGPLGPLPEVDTVVDIVHGHTVINIEL